MKYVLCMGGNKQAPCIAKESGWEYGSRHDYKIYGDSLYMLDIKWKDYDFEDYLDKVYAHKPYMAMVADYESPEQKDLLYYQIELLRPLVQKIMVCPKFLGAVTDIPSECVVAVSVMSDYAGFEPPAKELANRDIHLLGGNFNRQADMMRKYNAYGEVISLDSASHVSAANHGRYFYNGKWMQTRKKDWSNEELAIYSGKHLINWFEIIRKEKQPSLF